MPIIPSQRAEVVAISCVGKFIEVDDRFFGLRLPVQDKIRPDKQQTPNGQDLT